MRKIRSDKGVKARECAPVLLRLPKHEHQELRVIAAEDGMSMAAWLERLARPAIQKRAKGRAVP